MADQNFRVKRGLEVGVGGTVITTTASGSVGIGSTNPTATLDVIGNVRFTGVATAASFSGNASSATYATSAGIATYATSAGIATYASTAGIATIAGYASTAGVSTSVIGGIASVTQLNVSGISTLGVTSTTNLTAQQLNVSGVGTFQSSNLKIVGASTSFQYSIVGSTITADRNLTLPLITGNDTVAVLGLSQTFSSSNTFSGTLSAQGQVSLQGQAAGVSHFFGTNQTTATLTFGGTSGTGLITFGRSTASQQTDIQAGASGVGTTKTINFGTGGLSGSNTQINIGPTSGVGTVVINSGTNLGIGSTTPTSALDVIGGAKFTGVVTATSFSGNASSATYATNAGIATYATSAGIATYATSSGIATYATSAGIATYATTSGVATALQNARNFSITGNFVTATAISFDGTGNVALAATITPDSIGLGTYTTGDYVKNISGTSNQITVTGGTGEGSTPTLSIPSQFTAPQDVTVTRDLQVNRNLNVTGNITIGGTTAFINVQQLQVADPDLVLGFRTDAFGNDVSNDTTANHGGIAIASTEGNPLVSLYNPGIGESTVSTYKKIMWFKSGSFSGLGTDAWLINYAVGIGSTQFPAGTRLAAGNVQFTQNDLSVVRNINASGVVTATSFSGNASSATYATSAGVSTSVIGGIGSVSQLQVTGISTFTNGPVFIGAATSTGTASQPLQVTGGASFTGVGASVGIGTTNPTSTLQVNGTTQVQTSVGSTQSIWYTTLDSKNYNASSVDLLVQPETAYSFDASRTAGKFYEPSIFSHALTSANGSYSATLLGLQNFTNLAGTESTARINGYGFYNGVYRNSTTDVSSYASNSLTGSVNLVSHLTNIDQSVVTGFAYGSQNAVSIAKATATNIYTTYNSTSVGTPANRSASSTNAYGSYNVMQVGAASGTGIGTITNYYGYYVSPTVALTGQLTNYYGLYLATPIVSGTLTNRYSIYSSDTSSPMYHAGSIGIGTTNPTQTLDVNGNVTARGTVLVNTSTGSGSSPLQVNGNIGLAPNSQIRQWTASDGGTLQVFATQVVSGSNNSDSYGYSGGGLLAAVTNGDGVLLLDVGRGGGSPLGRFKVTNTSGGNISLSLANGSSTTLYTDTGSGNLGIGTASPAFKADIAGDARVTSTNKMRFGGTSGTTNFYIQYNSTANSLDFVAG